VQECLGLGFTLLILLGPLLLLAFAVRRVARVQKAGEVVVRRWAKPVFVLSVLASFPIAVSLLYTIVVVRSATDVELAPWIRDAWKTYGWLTAFCWVAGLGAIWLFNGAEFKSAEQRKKTFWPLAKALLVLTGLWAGMFWALTSQFGLRLVKQAVSPDGRQCLRINAQSMLGDVWFPLECYDKRTVPLWSRFLGDVVVRNEEFGPNKDLRIVWSGDSGLAVVYYGEQPYAAYDFSKGMMLRESEAQGDWRHTSEQRRQNALAEFRKAVDEEIRAHGGPAP